MFKLVKTVLTAAFVISTAQIASADIVAAMAEGEGRINTLNFGSNSMVVGGYEYLVSDSAEVEINGSYGAFTLLEEGMFIEFTFERHSDGVRRVTDIVQVAEVEQF